MQDASLAGFRSLVPASLRGAEWRAFPLDGKLLLFNRRTGLNILLEGDETTHWRRVAPRTLLIAVTNTCNLRCPFCYRDTRSASEWTRDSLLELCRYADRWGVLEVAFGGGEPMLFPEWASFLGELHDSTGLCLNFTTNGMLLDADFLRAVSGKLGQIRLSLYDDNQPERAIALLVDHGGCFGVNWLMTPKTLETIEAGFSRLLGLGVRDFLFISYKGDDRSLHLGREERRRLSAFLNALHVEFGDTVSLKLDGCWGDALHSVPRLFQEGDCGAGEDFLSITSDRRLKPCSFHRAESGVPFTAPSEVRTYWERRRREREAAPVIGCARLAGRGLDREESPP